MKKGDAVRYEIPDIVGYVIGATVDEDGGHMLLVEYRDAEGKVHQRYFRADELKKE